MSVYTPDRQYYKQVALYPNGPETTIYVGGILEKVLAGSHMSIRDILKWAYCTLTGHVILWQLLCGLPLLLLVLIRRYRQGHLSIAWGLEMVFWCIALWGAAGAIFWFTITKPFIERNKK